MLLNIFIIVKLDASKRFFHHLELSLDCMADVVNVPSPSLQLTERPSYMTVALMTTMTTMPSLEFIEFIFCSQLIGSRRCFVALLSSSV